MINKPLVSILMTAYNRQKFIAEAIESVLASTYENWELIIVDDGSSDNTVRIVKTFLERNSRIKLYINDHNLGDYPNRNKAAGYARGEYIMFVDSDDQIFPDTIDKVISVMERFPRAGFATFSPLQNTEPIIFDPEKALRNHFFKEPFLMYGPGATVVKNDYFKKIKGYPEKYGPANDMYYNLKAASGTDIVVLSFPLVNYRRHAGQEINNSSSYLYNNYLYQRDALAELELPLDENEKKYLNKKNKRRFVVNLCKTLLKEKDIHHFQKLIKLTDFTFKDFYKGIFHWYPKKPVA